MSDHYKIVCRACQAVIAQCRCPGDKPTSYAVCEACQNGKRQKG